MANIRKECNVCGVKVIDLRGHMLVHKPKLFKCELCPRTLRQAYLLRRHIKHVHDKLKPFGCVFCDKVFSEQHQLWNHFLRHIEEKPHDCTICGKSFCANGNLNEHIRYHTREKPYKCGICKKSFSRQSTLKRHGLTHELECQRIRYKCKECHKTYKTPLGLKRHHEIDHLQTEPRHWCVFCGKGFHQIANFYAHLRNHTNEKPFNCARCDKPFLTPSNRRDHFQRVHERGMRLNKRVD